MTVQNLNISGTLTINASNVTVNNVCVTTSGNSGSMAVVVGSNASNLLLEHSIFKGSASSGTGVIDTGVFNPNNIASVSADSILITNAAEDWHGAGTVKNSYMQAGAFYSDASGPSHNEDIYLSDTSITLDHDTLLNSASQTAVLFGDNNGGSKGTPGDNHWTVTNSLLAGGGYLAYLNAGATSQGTSTMNITNNRFARCTGATNYDGWGTQCNDATATSAGTLGDKYGYYPNGGYYGGVIYDYCGTGQTWTNNVWDNNRAAIACPRKRG
jgi:hypothetical protein